jgi:hypothetical protein
MRFFDTGPHANGFIAIGGEATGVIAIGQIAHGFIAIGQVAIGVIAIGQLSVGIWGVGMVGAGVAWFFGFGPGGRGVFHLIPDLHRPRDYPEPTTIDRIRETGEPGFVQAELDRSERGRPRLVDANGPLPVKLSVGRLVAVRDAMDKEYFTEVFAQIAPHGDTLVCERMVKVTPPTTTEPGFWPGLVGRAAALCLVAAVVWAVLLPPLIGAVAREVYSFIY